MIRNIPWRIDFKTGLRSTIQLKYSRVFLPIFGLKWEIQLHACFQILPVSNYILYCMNSVCIFGFVSFCHRLQSKIFKVEIGHTVSFRILSFFQFRISTPVLTLNTLTSFSLIQQLPRINVARNIFTRP